MISKIADFWDVTFYSQASRHEEVQNTRQPPLLLCNHCTSKRVMEISQLDGGGGETDILTFRNL